MNELYGVGDHLLTQQCAIVPRSIEQLAERPWMGGLLDPVHTHPTPPGGCLLHQSMIERVRVIEQRVVNVAEGG